MKVPLQNQQQSSFNSTKQVINSVSNHLNNITANTTTNSNNSFISFELKSVTDKPVTNPDNIFGPGVWDENLQLEDHVLNQPEDWDSLMRDLGLHEDSTFYSINSPTNPTSRPPPATFPQFDSQTHYPITNNSNLSDFPPASNSFDSAHQLIPSDFSIPDISTYPSTNPSFDDTIPHHNWNLEYVDELIRLAECFETNTFHLSHVILDRLNQRLRSPSGRPRQRAAFYFKEALQYLLTGSTRTARSSTSSEVVQSIKAHKSFTGISPIPTFSSFTANQAVLEALDGSMLIHVIDFDIGLGGHWASFLKELADKAESCKTAPPVLRITAVVAEEYAIESKLIRENLTQFARDLDIGFEIDFVLMRTFEFLSFNAVKFMEDENIAVLLSPGIFRSLGTGFLNDLRRVSPHVVVHLDCEGLTGFGTASFRQSLIDGLEFYSTLLESLEAANGGGVEEWMKKIETFVLYPKILEVVGLAGRRGKPWREAFAAAGLRPVALSQFADFQAECLIRRVQVRGFHVARRQAEMLLCWHERALVATSAWRF